MKVKIHYEYDARFENKYWASASGYHKSGNSYQEARTALIALLKERKLPNNIPPDEEVEI